MKCYLFTCGLFNDAICSSEGIFRMTRLLNKNELDRMLEEIIVT